MSCLAQLPGAIVPRAVKVTSVTMASERILMRAHRGHRNAYAHHRKSAVELLEESKSSYVKSSTVLNHKQELKHPENLSVSVRETSAVLSSLTHSKSDYELLRPSSEKKHEEVSVEKIKDNTCASYELAQKSKTPPPVPARCSSDEPVRKSKTPPPVPARKPSPTTSKGVDGWNLNKRHSPTSTPVEHAIEKQSSDKPHASMSNQDKVRPSSFTPPNTANQDQMVKRFSSLSASAAVGGSKDASERDHVDGTDRSASSVQSNGRDSTSNTTTSGSMFKPPAYGGLSTSVGVLVEQPKPLPKKMEKMEENGEVPRRRQLHRSHSDLSSCRHSRTSSDYSDLSSRLSRTSTEIERFFNEMGLDRTVLDPMLRLQDSKRKDFLDSLSSIDSQDARSFLSGNELDRVPTESEQDLMERSTTGTSVVERNARIIKWLYNVKKARNGPRQHVTSS